MAGGRCTASVIVDGSVKDDPNDLEETSNVCWGYPVHYLCGGEAVGVSLNYYTRGRGGGGGIPG